MRLRDLLKEDTAGALVGSPEMDPLTEKDALQEARLNEVLFDAVNRRVGLLFDLRGALQLRMAHTGLLVLGGVEGLGWNSERRPSTRTAWNVVGSLPVNENGVINLRLFFFPDAELTIVARSAAFYAGDVPGLPDTPPDFADSDEAVAAGMASLDSPFEPTQATVIRPRSLRRLRTILGGAAGPVRFVVRLHDATALHFDWPSTTRKMAGGARILPGTRRGMGKWPPSPVAWIKPAVHLSGLLACDHRRHGERQLYNPVACSQVGHRGHAEPVTVPEMGQARHPRDHGRYPGSRQPGATTRIPTTSLPQRRAPDDIVATTTSLERRVAVALRCSDPVRRVAGSPSPEDRPEHTPQAGQRE